MDADWGIIGNQRAITALKAGLKREAAVHAYLFSGPEGTGRATAARRLAMALNCESVGQGPRPGESVGQGPRPDSSDLQPCGECKPCRRIESGLHADIQTVAIDTQAEGPARKSISVEQMREIEAAVARAPYEGRNRVVIIDPADLMSDGAQNSFLKTLEEPPPHAVFVLISANDEKLLETIRSRCTRVEFRLVPSGDIAQALLGRGVSQDRADLLARLAGGRPGWALSAAADARFLERRAQRLAAARSLPAMRLSDRFDLAGRLSDAFKREREPVLRQMDDWAGWWRDVLLAQSGARESIANIDESEAIAAAATEYSRKDVARFVRAILETRGHLGDNVQSRLALDALMLSVPD